MVYKARQFSLNQFVALKMVIDSRKSSAKAVRQFRLEAELAARLRHPNIVRIYQVGEEDGDVYFTMELIDGQSLSRRIAQGEFRLAPAEATKPALHEIQVRIAKLIAKTARAAHYAHGQGVWHRDIKPGNIIVDGEDEPHLTDFGLAKPADNETNFSDSDSLAGTPAYMSPEQARGAAPTAATDTYSLGVILYELLTGRTPFHGATPVDTLRQISDLEAPSPAQITKGRVDADLATICLKCLEKNPFSRYATALDLAEDLERWIRGEPIRARPIGNLERVHRWIHRNPVGATLITVLVLSVMGTSLLLFRLSQANDREIRRADAIADGLVATIEKLWPDPKRLFELISSEQLSAFLDEPKRPVDYDAPLLRLTMGISVTESPLSQVRKYAKPFAEIEEAMSKALGRQVLLDLKLFKFKRNKVGELISDGVGNANFGTIGPLSYVKAKQIQPGLIPIARDDLWKPAVFFARKGSGITNLTQVSGHRVAFGSEGATISLIAKRQLHSIGITGASLAGWQHYGSKSIFLKNLGEMGLRNVSLQRYHSHSGAIKAVTDGTADVGVARREYIQDRTKNDLEIIADFESPPQLWVASTNIADNVVESFRHALIGTKTIDMIGGPRTERLTRMVPVEDAYYEPIRKVLASEVRQFEGAQPVQTGSPEEIFEDDE